MPILSGDIKLLASQVMDDVPEGGGAPTAIVIADGVSNAVFPDVSEVARAGGQVGMRKLFVSVATNDTDTYMDTNLIVAEPPQDPNISVTLFSTNSTFDTRDSARGRVEGYLNAGPSWGGVLFENHIAGQRVMQVLQRPEAPLPAVGQTMVLSMNEGEVGAYSQYVRATVVVPVDRTFHDDSTGYNFVATVVSVSVSDALRYDFPGSSAKRTFKRDVGSTVLRDSLVADAGTYVGVVPLLAAANIGDFTVSAESIYSQLVPSAQTETPIADVRSNGLSGVLVATGGAITQTLTMAFTTTTDMFVGGPIYPGTLNIVRSGVTAIDVGGLLTVAGAEVGQVDYDNGVVSLSTNPWGAGAGAHAVTFTPATVPDLISDQRAIRVTSESRSLSYVFTLPNVPVARALSVSYLAQGRWYVLRDNGAGVLKGSSSAFGVGTLSYSTGTVSITLGALPDVGSSLVIQSYSSTTTTPASNTQLTNGARAFVAINTNGLLSTERGAKSITPSALSITWAGKTATDDGAGGLTGDATGTVGYSGGTILFSPNTLPAPGTVFTVNTDNRTQGVASGVLLATGSLGALSITPKSVSFPLFVTITYNTPANVRVAFRTRQSTLEGYDDAGNLYVSDNGVVYPCGTINYATGIVSFIAPTLEAPDLSGPVASWVSVAGGGVGGSFLISQHSEPWTQAMTPLAGLTRTMTYAAASDITYCNTAAVANTFTVTPASYMLQTRMVPNYVLKGVGFTLGTSSYRDLTDGTVFKDVSPTTGGGTPAGSVTRALGVVTINNWPTGASSLVTDWRGLLTPPSVGVAAPFMAFSSTFRTVVSPLRPASLSILGTMQDGTTFNVTAGVDGKINSTRVKGRVDAQYGLVELYFVDPVGDVALNVDLTHLGIAGLTTIPADLVMLNTLRYNAVSFSYLPLDATLLGIDPVRLPSDGRVPIFRAGGYVVVAHTGKITATVSNAQVIDCARVRLSRVRVVGFNKAVINTGYTADLEAGTVTFSNVTGYSQPVTIEHRIEDMSVVNELQISGELRLLRPLTHNYPTGSFVSSALMAGNLKARVSHHFDQETWTGVWSEVPIGNSAPSSYNAITYPVAVVNAGAITERWSLQFTSSTVFRVTGEHVGVVGSWSINDPSCAPNNPAAGMPYFTVDPLGWGTGWAVGNVVRINTVGAMAPVWVVRTIQQGPATGTEHSFTLLSRGDVNAP